MRHFTLLLLALSPLLTHAQDLQLTEQEVQAFSKMTQQKVNELGNNLSTLCDKTQSEEMKETAMMLALELFIDDRQTVQTSSLSKNAVYSEFIGIYLNRLRVLNYAQVTIKWYNIQYQSELKKGRDGKYYATMTIFQEFTGWGGDGQAIYKDYTQKNIDIIVDMDTIQIGDRTLERPTVKLGNISVIETK